jgi:ketosteroid isomerase-like protein
MELEGYAAMGKLLKRDGYRVTTSNHDFSIPESLAETDVLVIINSLHESNVGNWARPVLSAFTDKEIKNLERWVKRGGQLLIVGDHMPFGGAVRKLGAAFGCEWVDGFARIQPYYWPPSHFEGSEMVNAESPVIKGLQKGESLNRIATFTGSAFKAPPEAVVALAFKPENSSVQPDTSWRFKDHSPEISLAGYAQGATLDYGEGRVAFWGEAGMLAAQVFRQDWRAGFNSAYAPENAQMMRNLFHWLSGAQAPFTTPMQQPVHQEKTKYENGIEPLTNAMNSTFEAGHLFLNEAVSIDIQTQLSIMEEAYETGDLLTLSYVYADDALISGAGFRVEGREAIDKYWFSLQGLTEQWQLESDLIYVNSNEDVAYQLGKSTLTYRSPGSEEVYTSSTRFALVWKKNFAGNWKIVSDQYEKE